MALYFFHLRDGTDIALDEEGRNLGCMNEVAAAALREARALMAADILGGRIDLALRIEAEDADGKLVHRLEFADAVEILRMPAPPPGESL